MSPEILTNVLLQVPALGVVVYLVVHFLAYLRSSRDDEREFMTRLTKDQSEIIERNTRALLENHEIAYETREMLAQVRVTMEHYLSTRPFPGNGSQGKTRD